MKITKLLLLALLSINFIQCSSETENQYTISGYTSGLDVNKGYILIIDTTAPRGFRQDSVIIENGKINYSSSISQPEVMRMSFASDKITKWVGTGEQRGYIPVKSAILQYIAFPGANITLKGEFTDFVNVYPYGDKENELLTELLSQLNPILNKGANLYVKSVNDTTLTKEQVKILEEKSNKLNDRANEIRLAFLDKNASSIAGLWLMEDMLMRSQIKIEKVDELMKKVDAAKYQNLSYYIKVSERVKGYKASAIGQIAPSVKGINLIDDKEFNIESLRGKFVLLDFWGTWCGACLHGTPAMKEFRDKHIDKLQIVGLAKDRKASDVKKVMANYKMDWPNILVVEGGELDYVAKYNVQGYSTKVLIDPNGKILLRTVGEDPKFYNKIEEIILKESK